MPIPEESFFSRTTLQLNSPLVTRLHWLFKEDPTHYSFDDLIREKETNWTGVHNNLALIHLRNVKKGDTIFFYHTEDEKQIVGIMRATSDAYATDNHPVAKSKEVAVDVEPVEKLRAPVGLQQLKRDKRLKNFPLVRISRLSVMPVTDEQWKLINSIAGED